MIFIELVKQRYRTDNMTSTNSDSSDSEFQLIQDAMNERQYELAIDVASTFLHKALESHNEDHLAYCLEIYDALCDKTPVTIEMTLKNANILLDNKEYWVRQEALTILKKIFKVVEINKFDPIIERCETKLFDSDKKVRESAVNLIASILKKSFDYYPDLYLTYSQMFEDESWRVRAQALEGMLDFLTPTSQPPVNLLKAIQFNFFKLIRDPDEEIRGLTTEAIKALSYHLPGPELVNLILPILSDTDWEIREKGIWIVGEIGARFYSDFEPIFHKLVDMFSDTIMMIQTKTIDAFVKIGKSHGSELLQFFKKIIQNNNLHKDTIEGITESTIYFTLQNMRGLLICLIDELTTSIQKFRDFIGECLIKIYIEKPDAFEEELARMYQSLDPEDWRQRKRIIKLLGDLSYILHIQSVAVWTTINLRNWKKEEKDLDVLDEIDISLAKIQNIFEEIDLDIQEIENQRKEFYDSLDFFQKRIQEMRLEIGQLVETNKFQKAEEFMEEESQKIAEKLNEYEKILNNSEFKRYSVEIVQDFKEIKDEVLDNISDVKYIMLSKISDKREIYLEILNEEIEKLTNRINQMGTNFEVIRNLDDRISATSLRQNPELTEQLIEKIAIVRKSLYDLEFEIGQIWLKNLEFKEALKEVTLKWVDLKIEVQQYLATVLFKFKELESAIPEEPTDEDESRLKKKITLDFLSGNLQKIVLQAIQNVHDMMESFGKITNPIYTEITKKRFGNARNLVKMTIENIQNSIDEYNKEIDSIYRNIDQIDITKSNPTELYQYIKNWSDAKFEINEFLDNFGEDVEDEIISAEIAEYLTYMNPLSLYHLNRIYNLEAEALKSMLFKLIKNHKLMAEIRNNTLVQPNQPLGENFLQLQRKVEIIGTKIIFDLRITNPTAFFMNDLTLIFIHPPFLKLQGDESDPPELIMREFEPESARVIHWVFKIEKTREKRYELNKWLLNINYRNPFGKLSSIQKEMEIIL